MAETDNTTPGGVNDPVQMRNTKTEALKRIPVTANSASASSAAKKTIKLKPLMPSSADSPSPAPVPAPKSVSSILINHKPASPQTDEPPKFMSTNTAPIGKIAKPTPEKPIPAANLNDAPTKTVSIPRLQAKMTAKPPVPAAATATATVPKVSPAPPPAPAVPGGKTATVTVPKVNLVKPQPEPAQTVKTATVTVPKVNLVKPQPEPAQTIRTATATVPKVDAESAPQPEISEVPTPKSPTVLLTDEDVVATSTQGIKKQAIDQAKMQSGLQGAKPAIKLRPSAGSPQTPETLSPVSPTIKLVPKKDSAVSPIPPAESEKTAKPEVTVTTKIPRKTLQLKPKMPTIANEARLKEQGDIANQQIKSGVEEGDQAIQQAGIDDSKLDTMAGKQLDTKKGKKDAGEPNIIFSISAILAFLVIGYTVFALTAQFLSIWEGKQIPVAGFQQIFEKSKK